ncbi:hypothetical protein [Candidatus Thiosymbion oneisti]|uniref:hypothetical protein n=1 Tax=Candidatus Thiosymbion oneisti TaxID=589554 RepID=UPI000B7F24CC|nr:hypothetical protein [Candidatus Thiosymbion oneisti]
MKMKIPLIAVSLALILGGCTTIKITDRGGVVTIAREFGFASVQLHPETDALVAEISSLGYLATPIGQSFGYTKQFAAFLPENCKVILWVEDPEQVSAIKTLLGDIESVCPIYPTKQKENS